MPGFFSLALAAALRSLQEELHAGMTRLPSWMTSTSSLHLPVLLICLTGSNSIFFFFSRTFSSRRNPEVPVQPLQAFTKATAALVPPCTSAEKREQNSLLEHRRRCSRGVAQPAVGADGWVGDPALDPAERGPLVLGVPISTQLTALGDVQIAWYERSMHCALCRPLLRCHPRPCRFASRGRPPASGRRFSTHRPAVPRRCWF